MSTSQSRYELGDHPVDGLVMVVTGKRRTSTNEAGIAINAFVDVTKCLDRRRSAQSNNPPP